MPDQVELFDCQAAYDRLPPEVQAQLGVAAIATILGTLGGTLGHEKGRRFTAAQAEGTICLINLVAEHVIAGDPKEHVPFPDLACIGVQACRECGCTEHAACEAGCGWVERGLCSACVPQAAAAPAGSLEEWERIAFTPGLPGEPKLPYQVRVTEELQNLADGGCSKLLLMMPLELTTTELVTCELFTLWFMAHHPGAKVLITGTVLWTPDSYTSIEATLARHESFLDMKRVPGQRLKTLTMSNGSSLTQLTLEASMPGMGFDLIVVRQPLQLAQMNSREARERAWAAFNQNVLARLQPGGKVVVLGATAHEDDLVSRLHGDPTWRTVRMPMMAEADDPLGRAEGELLVPRLTMERALSAGRGFSNWNGLLAREAHLQAKPYLKG